MKRILVADDDPAIVEALTLMLEAFGYTVRSTLNGNTIYKMEMDLPDLIVLDIWMSGQDGRDICRYLKARNLTKTIPIIMISASKDVAISAKRAGADDFIAKPFEMDALLAKVSMYIGIAP